MILLLFHLKELNSSFLVQRVKRFKAQFAFVFGCDLIKGELFEALPEFNVNLHLGLSPWYKGSATLFWPFVLLEPQFAGVTFHKLALAADAGGIIHQSTPDLKRGDGVHDVGTRCVIDAAGQAIRICKSFLANGSLEVEKQHSNGRLWLMRDFHPSHLRIIYTQFGDRIVDRYLDGDLSHRTPKLVSTCQTTFCMISPMNELTDTDLDKQAVQTIKMMKKFFAKHSLNWWVEAGTALAAWRDAK